MLFSVRSYSRLRSSACQKSFILSYDPGVLRLSISILILNLKLCNFTTEYKILNFNAVYWFGRAIKRLPLVGSGNLLDLPDFRFRFSQILKTQKARAGNSLHLHQLKSLIQIFKKMFKDFELQGILDCRRDPWKAIQQRLTVIIYTISRATVEIFIKKNRRVLIHHG